MVSVLNSYFKRKDTPIGKEDEVEVKERIGYARGWRPIIFL